METSWLAGLTASGSQLFSETTVLRQALRIGSGFYSTGRHSTDQQCRLTSGMVHRCTVAPLLALPPGTGKAFTVAGRQLALFNVNGRIFAIDNICPHDGGPLADGPLQGMTIICPRHGAEFDLSSGKVLCPPPVENVQRYPAFVNGDSIEVEL